MDFLRSQFGTVRIELVSADISSLLSQISQRNITAEHLMFVDEMTVRASVLRKDYTALKELVNKRDDRVRILGRAGAYWRIKSLKTRPIFLSIFAFLLMISLFLPTRILFVRVEGNEIIPTNLILEKAEESGIRIFASRRKVRSEKIKNALIEKIPELQWAGVNTQGCVATICVTEKTVRKQQETPAGICSIVASRDGIVSELTVTQGNPVCQVGQAVKSGQVLVSGYTDCGICIKGTRADAEVYAQTMRKIQVVTPVNTIKRGEQKNQKTNYSLLLGKKLIKLHKGSGISDTSCVRIYEEKKLTLPGGFELPIALICEKITQCDYTVDAGAEDQDWLLDEAIDYLQTQMIAGQILDQEIKIDNLDGIYCLYGQFSCLEMIGQVKNEEIIKR